MKSARSLALVCALSVAAGGCVNKASSRAFAVLGTAMMAGAVIGSAVHEPAPPSEDSTGLYIDGFEIVLAGTFLVGLAVTLSAGVGYVVAGAAESSSRRKAAAADVTQRDRDAALAIEAARAGDCATVKRQVRVLRAVDPDHANAIVLREHLVADCLDEPFLGGLTDVGRSAR